MVDVLVVEGFGYFCVDILSECLSGGECMCVVLFGVFFDDVDFFIFDELSNFFDGLVCVLLWVCLVVWDGGLLLVSYDCELLEGM